MNARYYVPGIARFASADTVVPNPTNPQSINRYSYVRNNPINSRDPSGHCGVDQKTITTVLTNIVLGTVENFTYTIQDADKLSACKTMRDDLEEKYGINITGRWTLWEMERLEIALQAVIDAFIRAGLTNTEALAAFKDLFEGVNIKRVRRFSSKGRAEVITQNRIHIYNGAFFQWINDAETGWGWQARSVSDFTTTVAHELGHIWDRRMGYSLANGIKDVTGGTGDLCLAFLCTMKGYQPGLNAPNTGYDISNSREDWASSFAAFVVDQNKLLGSTNDTTRLDFVRDRILELR